MSYQRLIREHDELATKASELEALLGGGARNPAAAAGLLHELAFLVREHLSYEDRRVYSRLIELRSRKDLPSSAEFEALCEALRDDWEAYLVEWDEDCIRADWEEFSAATTALMARLRERVCQETNLIYPLALKEGLIKLRD